MALDLSEYSLSKTSPKLITTPPSPEREDSLLVVHHTASSVEDFNKVAHLKHQKKKRKLDDPQPRDVERTKIHKAINKDNSDNNNNSSNKLNLKLLDLYLSSEKPNDVKDNYYGLNLLCWACQCKSLDAVKKILQQGDIDINQSNGPHQMTALHIAAAVDFISGIDYLVQQPNLNLNQQDKAGLTALHYTARSNHYNSAKVLLEAGARLDLFDINGKLALHYAIRQNYVSDIVDLFLQKRERNNPSWTNLIWSTSSNNNLNCVMEEAIAVIRNIQIMHQLVRAGAFIAIEQGGWWEDAYNFKRNELLDLCIHWNRFDCLKYLVQETNITQEVDYTLCQRALNIAVQQRKLDLVIYLCRTVQISPCDANGYNTAFLYAANHGFMEMIPYLLTSDTSPDCIHQALLFAKLIGKKKNLGDILYYYKINPNLKKSKTSDISITTVNNAVNSIFQLSKK
ncbi:hypothetical protein INT46_001946 [Mucor plumbeus]|uniref:Uncharacterized protein n=1 Tax=Mucor plumbeus TaxID=97098 RepID=A0A8H7QN65_9FUNG|nr:hypothetical protein INT46_001946 [Mucor plumbeus]